MPLESRARPKPGSDRDAILIAAVESKLAHALSKYRVPGAAIAVHIDGARHVMTAGVLEIGRAALVQPDSLFQIGSVTKPFVATQIMQLVDERRLDLDRPVQFYLPEFRLEDREASQQITTRHLLSHTGGFDGDLWIDVDGPRGRLEAYIRECARLPQYAPPGALFSYCNSGYVVAGRLVEVLTDREWDDALASAILDPLALRSASTSPTEQGTAGTAAGHFPARDALRLPEVARPSHLPLALGPAGASLKMSATDLLTFAEAHMGAAGYDGVRLLSRHGTEAMREVQASLDAIDGMAQPGGWGLGWALYDCSGVAAFGHDGSAMGQEAFLRVAPDRRCAVALLANSEGAHPLWRDVGLPLFQTLAGIAVLPARPGRAIGKAALHSLPGRYENLLARITIRVAGRSLVLERTFRDQPGSAQPPPVKVVEIEPALFGAEDPETGELAPLALLPCPADPATPLLRYNGRLYRRITPGTSHRREMSDSSI